MNKTERKEPKYMWVLEFIVTFIIFVYNWFNLCTDICLFFQDGKI
jgi:hypothetical protein